MNSPTTTSPGQQPVEVEPKAVRVLIAATVLFAVCFAVWVMFSIIGLKMRKELGLSDGQFALLAAIPVLTGALLRIPVGIIADRIGGRATMMTLMLIVAIPVYLVSKVNSYGMALVLALFVGLAGTSFAAGVAWVSAWYPAERKGFALGMFGMGNIGAALTALVAPTLLTLVPAAGLAGGLIGGQWRFVPVMYAALLVLAALLVRLVVPGKDRKPAGGRTFTQLISPLKYVRVWRFGYYYMTVFGAFVAMSLWLPKYYVDNYDMQLRSAGFLAAAFVITASVIRPIGGALADRIGGRKVMILSLGTAATAALFLSLPMGRTTFFLLTILLGAGLGIGTAAVFTYIPQYFPDDVGAVGGLVGAIGAIGGFILPLIFATVKGATGYAPSIFVILMAMFFYSALFLALAISNLRSPSDPLHAEK
jgi:NNP family nitrate/nitrite transporter-like MFS transporter